MRLTILPIVAAAMLSLAGGAMAQEAQMVPGNIRAIKVDGTAWQTIGNQGQRERLKEGDFLRQGNSIETAADGSVILLFDNGSNMTLRPNTKFSIDKFLRDPFDAEKIDYKTLKSEPSRSVTKVKVREGTILFDLPKLKISKGSSCDISNPVGTAGIRGTDFKVTARRNADGSPKSSSVSVATGQVGFN
ncbi:MAG: FecR domain-containing protein, partial [Chthoniobacterales bacterium]